MAEARRDPQHRSKAPGAPLAFGFFRVLPLDCGLGRRRLSRAHDRPASRRHQTRAATNLRRALPELDRGGAQRRSSRACGTISAASSPNIRISANSRCSKPGGRIEGVGARQHPRRRARRPSATSSSRRITAIGRSRPCAAAQAGFAVAQSLSRRQQPARRPAHHPARAAPSAASCIPKGDDRGAAACRRRSREGRALCMLVDQKMNDGIAVPFFGRDAMTAPALARLALRYRLRRRAGRASSARKARVSASISRAAARCAARPATTHADVLRADDAGQRRSIERWIRASVPSNGSGCTGAGRISDHRHCERSEAIQCVHRLDCFVAALSQ